MSRYASQSVRVVALWGVTLLTVSPWTPEVMAARSGSPGSAASAVTVADLIELNRFGKNVHAHYSDEDRLVPSPDGTHAAVLIHKGNLQLNTRDFTLMLFPTRRRIGTPQIVASFSSSSNRPAISQVRWSVDSARLIFFAERPQEAPQLYTYDIRTRTLTQQTHEVEEIDVRSLRSASSADVFVYTVKEPIPAAGADLVRRRAGGFVVSPKDMLDSLIAGEWGLEGGNTQLEKRPARSVTVVRDGRTMSFTLPNADAAAGYEECPLQEVSPDGNIALLACRSRIPPQHWQHYDDAIFNHFLADREVAKRLVVMDLHSGRWRILMQTPFFSDQLMYPSIIWAPDSRSFVIANSALPLDGITGAELEARRRERHIAEVQIATGAVRAIASQENSKYWTPERWDAATRTITLKAAGRKAAKADSSDKASTYLAYRKTRTGWVSARAAVPAPRPALRIEEGLNTPWRLVEVDARGKTQRVVYDPNPGLLEKRRFAPVTKLNWRTQAGAERFGTLYWPLDYERGRRYPLVIQAHGVNPDRDRFSPDGATTSGYAAQPLAGAGFFVLQAGDFINREIIDTPQEGPVVQATFESAVAELDRLGFIDTARIGMHGFSRTCYHVLYFMTHSSVPLAAATIVDGIDGSYLTTTIFSDLTRSRSLWAGLNGGAPFGESLRLWMERAPGFNLHRTNAALQVTAIRRPALLAEWEPYASMRMQGKPAELIYIPEGDHNLLKPWERMTSQQSTVDWYRFWLQGYEDSAPEKQSRYAWWRQMRDQRDAATKASSGADKSSASPAIQ